MKVYTLFSVVKKNIQYAILCVIEITFLHNFSLFNMDVMMNKKGRFLARPLI